MDKLLRRTVAALSVAMFSAALFWGASRIILAGGEPKRITVICTNDTLGTLVPCG